VLQNTVTVADDGKCAVVKIGDFCWWTIVARVGLQLAVATTLINNVAGATATVADAATIAVDGANVAVAAVGLGPAVVAGVVGVGALAYTAGYRAGQQVEPAPEPQTDTVTLPDPEQWRAENEAIIEAAIGDLRELPPKYHLFLGHRQVGGGAQVSHLYEMWRSLGVSCWVDLAQTRQDTAAMIRGVAESSVYTLYLTNDALSKYVLLEAWAAMQLQKPVIVLADADSRKPSYAGGDVMAATDGWPQDLKDYFWTGRFVTWGGQPMEWSLRVQYAHLGTILDCCMLWESEGRAPVPSGRATWDHALGALRRREADDDADRAGGEPAARAEPQAEPEPEPEPQAEAEAEAETETEADRDSS
jgi:hypothetical protein